MRGAPFLAYPPVIASEDASEIIHYITNDKTLQDGNLVLVDTGCEYFGYASDITRCWPVSRKFSAAQRDTYEALSGIHEALLGLAATRVSLDELYRQMCHMIGREILHLGMLVDKNPSETELVRIARELCPHHVSHYLGELDCNRLILIRDDKIRTYLDFGQFRRAIA